MAYSSGGQTGPTADFVRQGIKLRWPDRAYSSGGQTWPIAQVVRHGLHLILAVSGVICWPMLLLEAREAAALACWVATGWGLGDSLGLNAIFFIFYFIFLRIFGVIFLRKTFTYLVFLLLSCDTAIKTTVDRPGNWLCRKSGLRAGLGRSLVKSCN